MNRQSLRYRITLHSLAANVLIWTLVTLTALWIAMLLEQTAREDALLLEKAHVEQVFGEIVPADAPFVHGEFDYPAFADALLLGNEYGLLLWHGEDLMIGHKQFVDQGSLNGLLPPASFGYSESLVLWPDVGLVSLTVPYPDLNLTLLLYAEFDEQAGVLEPLLEWPVILLLCLIVVISSAINAFAQQRALRPITALAHQLSAKQADDNDIDVQALPDELAAIGTEINRLSARYSQLQLKQSVALDKEKLFTVNAAHELLTPLTVLKSEVQLVQRQYSDSEFAPALGEINVRINRVTKTIEQLVSLARLEPQQADPCAYIHCDLNLLFHDTLALFGEQIDQKQLDIATSEAAQQDVNLQGNKAHLDILLKNVVENATKYCQPGGKLYYEMTNKEGALMFVVENQCEPIPDYQRQQLFDAFARRPGELESGSGLGLAIVSQICLLHGYHVRMLDARYLQGVRVEIHFG